jgi:copper chaperone CopZ
MTAVEILFRTAAQSVNIDAATRALANIREVYGIRRLSFDRAARTLRVEYDATRLNDATVAKLIRQAGLEIEAGLPLIAPQPAVEQSPAA